MKQFAIMEKEKGSLTVKQNNYRRARQADAAVKCFKHWRFQVEQHQKIEQIVGSLKMYKSGKLLSKTFENWRRSAALKRELRERNDTNIKHCRQMMEQRLLRQVFDSLKISTENR